MERIWLIKRQDCVPCLRIRTLFESRLLSCATGTANAMCSQTNKSSTDPPLRQAQIHQNHFFPLFLIPCAPVLRGPLLPFAFAASSALAFASIDHKSANVCLPRGVLDEPAFCFSWNALSSSSISPFGAFFGAFKGLALPPTAGSVEVRGFRYVNSETYRLYQHLPYLNLFEFELKAGFADAVLASSFCLRGSAVVKGGMRFSIYPKRG